MGDDADDPLGPVLREDLGRLAERAAGVAHVVQDDAGLVLHVTHQDHPEVANTTDCIVSCLKYSIQNVYLPLYFICLLPLLVYESEVQAEF